MKKLLLLLVLMSGIAFGSTNVTGVMKNPDGTAVVGDSANFVRFELAYCGIPNQPHVTGTTQVAPNKFDVKPDASGNVAVTLYGNNVITCGTVTGGTRWRVTYYIKGLPGQVCQYNITGGSWDLTTQLCDNSAPPPTPPAAVDSTYLRLDAGNSPVTGILSFSAGLVTKLLNSIRFADQYASLDAAIAVGSGIVIIPSTFAGAEASTCASVDGYTQSNTPANVTVWDLRPSSATCGYNVAFNSLQQGAQTRLSVWQKGSPGATATTSAILGTNQVTGQLSSSSMAGGTFEVDVTGAVTPSTGSVQAMDAEAAVRSTGGTLPAVQGFTASARIDRASATTNVTDLTSIIAYQPANVSSAGAVVTDAYAFKAIDPVNVGTRNNYAIYSQGNTLFQDAMGIDAQGSTNTSAGAKLLRFGGQNTLATAGVSQYSTSYGGVPYKFFPASHYSWLIGPQMNVSEGFEITPSTGSGGNTFTTPAFSIAQAGTVSAPGSFSTSTSFIVAGAHGETWTQGQSTELITLSTSGTTTDSSANLLPANSTINAVACRVNTTITTATDWSVGDGTTAARFSSANSTLTAGTTSVGMNQMKGGVSTDAAGPTQAAAAKLRITTTGTPGAGVIRCTVFYQTFVAPTS